MILKEHSSVTDLYKITAIPSVHFAHQEFESDDSL